MSTKVRGTLDPCACASAATQRKLSAASVVGESAPATIRTQPATIGAQPATIVACRASRSTPRARVVRVPRRRPAAAHTAAAAARAE
eukprot:scaffold59_cov70-Phaeocystis_antarctica.AAC.2